MRIHFFTAPLSVHLFPSRHLFHAIIEIHRSIVFSQEVEKKMDDGHIWLELIIIILLVLGNAVCSLAEIAIVGARKTKLQELIDEGNKSAVYALRLAEGVAKKHGRYFAS